MTEPRGTTCAATPGALAAHLSARGPHAGGVTGVRQASQSAKSRSGLEGLMARVTASQVEKCLRGVEYPASKWDLIEYAEERRADEQVIAVLRRLPEYTYRSD